MPQSSFFGAAMRGETEGVLRYLNMLTLPEKKAWYAGNALFYAAWKGHLSTIQALCEWGVDVNFINNSGQTAIMVAARWGHFDIVQALIQSGANIKAADSTGKTVADYAAEREHNDAIIDLLMSAH